MKITRDFGLFFLDVEKSSMFVHYAKEPKSIGVAVSMEG